MKVLKFFKKHPHAGAGARLRTKTVEQIRINVEWAKQYRDVISNWLHSNVVVSH